MQGALVVRNTRKRVAVMSYKSKPPIPTEAEINGCIAGMAVVILVIVTGFAFGYILYLLEAAK